MPLVLRHSHGKRSMSRILVTGVDGFTGRYLAELLARQDNEIVGISHNSISAPVAGLSISHVCDLANSSELNDIIADIRPDKVVHLAAIAYVSHGVIEDIYKTNVIGSRNLLEAISLAGGVGAVLMASSANVYGNRISGEIDEEITPDPINDYAVSKLSMEFVARLYKDRLLYLLLGRLIILVWGSLWILLFQRLLTMFGVMTNS